MKKSRQRASFLSRRRRSTAHLGGSQPRNRRLLGFESLEDRRMLAVLIVNSAADNTITGDGLVTLREAIIAANNDTVTDLGLSGFGADTIVFNATLSGQTITLGGTDLDINEALTIRATGLAANVTIHAAFQSRIFNITATTGNFTLAGLTLTGGRTTGNNGAFPDSTFSGGAIRSLTSGNLTIDQSTISGNSTAGSNADGGGIYTSSGDVTLRSSTVSGNSTAGNLADGGGIFTNSGDVTLRSSTVSGNDSSDDGGGIYSTYGAVTLTNSTVSGNDSSDDGGGIHAFSGNVTLMSSTVTENSAMGKGGGVFLGTPYNNPAIMTIANSIVAGNTADGGSPDLRRGNRALDVDFSLIGDTTASGITAGTGSGNILNQLAQLGPLANNIGPTQTHALLAGSPAIDAGDPTIAFNASEFDQRGTPFVRVFDGGVDGTRIDIGAYELQTLPASILVVDSSSNIDDGDFSAGQFSLREAIGLANGAPGPDTILFDMAAAGGTMNLAGTELEITEALTIDATSIPITAGKPRIDAGGGSRIFNITASTGDFTFAGLILIGGRTTANFEKGGAINSGTSGKLTIDRTAVSGNRTEGVLAFGGGIYAEGDVMLIGSNMSGNTTTGNASAGGGIFSLGNVTLTDFSGISTSKTTGDNAAGGGIHANGDVTLNNSQVNANSTTGANSFGGAIRSRGDVTLNNSGVILNSTAGDAARGGGISADGNVTLVFANVIANSTQGDDATGGGVYSIGNVMVTDSTVNGNSTEGRSADGGGIFASSGAVTLTSSTVRGNSSVGSFADGGGISTDSGNVTLTSSTVSGNISGDNGGGIFAFSGAVTLTGSTVSGNDSDDLGGGIYTSSGAVTLSSSTVSDNNVTKAFAGGGGIFTDSGAVTLSNSTVSGNDASFVGGGIYTSSGDVTLSSSTVTGNSAEAAGGVFVANKPGNPTFLIENSIVAGNTAAQVAPDLVPDPDSTLNVEFSLIGDTAGSGITVGTGAGNILDELALLGPLADNGGPTETHALLPGSPAIDAANSILTTDQRGQSVPIDLPGIVNAVGSNGSDIGAYEVQIAVDSADFDNDDDIDGADFLAWQRGFGTPNANKDDGDANNDNNVDAADLSIWETQFGGPAPLAAVVELSAISVQPSGGSSQWAVGSGQLSAVTAQAAEMVVVQAPAIGRRAELIDAAIAVETIRGGQLGQARLFGQASALDEEPVFAETYADRVFAAAAIVPAGAFADAYELPGASSSDHDAADDGWLTEELIERVFG